MTQKGRNKIGAFHENKTDFRVKKLQNSEFWKLEWKNYLQNGAFFCHSWTCVSLGSKNFILAKIPIFSLTSKINFFAFSDESSVRDAPKNSAHWPKLRKNLVHEFLRKVDDVLSEVKITGIFSTQNNGHFSKSSRHFFSKLAIRYRGNSK